MVLHNIDATTTIGTKLKLRFGIYEDLRFTATLFVINVCAMEKGLVVQDTEVVKKPEEQSLQLLPKFKDKKTGLAKKQNILEEDAYVEVNHSSRTTIK